MREGTTSGVMVADRPYGEFYDFYSVILEYFGYHHIQAVIVLWPSRWGLCVPAKAGIHLQGCALQETKRPESDLKWSCLNTSSIQVVKVFMTIFWKLCINFFLSNFCHVLNVVCFLLGDSPTSIVQVPTFWSTLPHLHRRVGMKMELTVCSKTLAFKLQTPVNHPEESIQHVLIFHIIMLQNECLHQFSYKLCSWCL
jgi:hypothetical protein